MDEIERAYQTLYLKPGASLREVFEAHEDLLALWDAERLADRPRLRSKAPEQIRKANEAYQLLLEHLGHSSRTGTARAGETIAAAPSAATEPGARTRPARAAAAARPSASLYEQVFHEKAPKNTFRVAVWAAAAAALLIILLTVLLRREPARPEPPAESAASSQTPTPGGTDNLSGPPLPSSGPGAAVAAGTVPGESPPPALDQEPQAGSPAEPAPVTPAPPVRQSPPEPQPAPARSSASAAPAAKPPERARQQRPAPDTPVLVREEVPATEQPPENPPEPVVAKPSVEEVAAYQVLLEKSDAARRLVDGRHGSMRFVEWKVVQKAGDEVWIDITAHASGGPLTHFVWSITPETGATRAMSQAARNLETDLRR